MNITISVESIDELCEVISFLRRARPAAKNLADLDLSDFVYKQIKSGGISTIGQLAQMTENELNQIPGIGKFSVRQIRNAIANKGWKE